MTTTLAPKRLLVALLNLYILHATRIQSVNVENSGSIPGSVGADNRLDTSVVRCRYKYIYTNVHLTTAKFTTTEAEHLISKDLESKLSIIVKNTVEQAVRDHFKKEMQALKGIIATLSSRVSELEEKLNSQPGNDEMEMLGSVNDTLVEQQQAASCAQHVSDHQQQLFEL